MKTRCFARAVGTYKTENFAFFDVEGQIVYRFQAAELHNQTVKPQYDVGRQLHTEFCFLFRHKLGKLFLHGKQLFVVAVDFLLRRFDVFFHTLFYS